MVSAFTLSTLPFFLSPHPSYPIRHLYRCVCLSTPPVLLLSPSLLPCPPLSVCPSFFSRHPYCHFRPLYSMSNLIFDKSFIFYLANVLFYFVPCILCYSVSYSILLIYTPFCTILYLFNLVFFSIPSCSLYFTLLFYHVFYFVNSILQSPKISTKRLKLNRLFLRLKVLYMHYYNYM